MHKFNVRSKQHSALTHTAHWQSEEEQPRADSLCILSGKHNRIYMAAILLRWHDGKFPFGTDNPLWDTLDAILSLCSSLKMHCTIFHAAQSRCDKRGKCHLQTNVSEAEWSLLRDDTSIHLLNKGGTVCNNEMNCQRATFTAPEGCASV